MLKDLPNAEKLSYLAKSFFEELLPRNHNGFIFAIDGTLTIDSDDSSSPQSLMVRQLAVLGEGERFIAYTNDDSARFLLVTGRPIREPVARYGPFVMNTQSELQKAVYDYQSGQF